jgi:tRNA nucleotidyltransferase (CCA-adding enzyme)
LQNPGGWIVWGPPQKPETPQSPNQRETTHAKQRKNHVLYGLQVDASIRLDGPHWGRLLDFYGGQRDLEAGIIRVLHSLSFIEDPTRILRAVRFEQRFQFQIEPRTAELIHDAADLLTRVSGARIRHELNLILQEQQPEDALARLQEIGVLSYIDEALAWEHGNTQKFKALRTALREAGQRPEPIERLYLALWFYRLGPAVHDRLISKLRLSARTRSLIEEGEQLRPLTAELTAPDLPNSRLDQLLRKFSEGILLVARVDSDDWVLRNRILEYQTHLRPQKISLTGAQLKQWGVRPGPIYRKVFQAVRAARLDGHIDAAEEEIELARTLIDANT